MEFITKKLECSVSKAGNSILMFCDDPRNTRDAINVGRMLLQGKMIDSNYIDIKEIGGDEVKITINFPKDMRCKIDIEDILTCQYK